LGGFKRYDTAEITVCSLTLMCLNNVHWSETEQKQPLLPATDDSYRDAHSDGGSVFQDCNSA